MISAADLIMLPPSMFIILPSINDISILVARQRSGE
jgi:hypothetical protein